MIKSGIKYSSKLNINTALESGFSQFEVYYSDIDIFLTKTEEQCENCNKPMVVGICVSLEDMTKQIFLDVLDKAESLKSKYIVISTMNCDSADNLFDIVSESKDKIKAIDIYIENNCALKNDRCLYGKFSDARQLRKISDKLNNIVESERFGVCIDIGYANVLGMNIRCLIEDMGSSLKLLHMNDNNGITLQNQLPYTFTTGRGELSTDWYRIIGALVRTHYQGGFIFNTTGLINRTPIELQHIMITLLKALEDEWSEQFEFEKKLKNSKNIILFGAGKMAQNYMEEWGDRYKPSFFVDNNSSVWGEVRMGIEIKSPQEIFNIPENDRLVLICNLFYDEVGEQLDSMDIKYSCYWDHYYL